MSVTSPEAVPATARPAARWTDDCQGKRDFDGPIVEVSTRYWPPNYQRGRHSAHSAILVLIADYPGEPDYRTVVDKDFSAPTRGEVEVLVEAWAKEQYDLILSRLGVPRT